MKQQLTDSEIQEVAKECARVIDEKKGIDIILLNLMSVNSYLDYFLIVTGNSFTHCSSIAREVQKFLGKRKFKERGRANLNSGWIALDYNELVVHVFTREMRDYYQLERLWADAAVITFEEPERKGMLK